MNKTLKTLALAASIALGGATLSSPVIAGAADDAIADAKEALKQADMVGGAWRDTGKMIEKAESLLQEGKTKEAEALAREAEVQSMLGYMQATSQKLDNLHI